ncbi:hypothetical protein VULLAG_LOCUS324 [Vulpes lagopus]
MLPYRQKESAALPAPSVGLGFTTPIKIARSTDWPASAPHVVTCEAPERASKRHRGNVSEKCFGKRTQDILLEMWLCPLILRNSTTQESRQPARSAEVSRHLGSFR